MWKTKTDIVELVKKAGHADLIKHSVSCSHVFEMSKLHTHCGRCSQCIDRRLATLSAGCQEDDPEEMYKTDVFVGDRSKKGQDIVLTESYVRTMKECAGLTAMQFFTRFGEISRVMPYMEGHSDDVAEQLYQLYLRNGRQVKQAQRNALNIYAEGIVEKGLPDRSLLRQLIGSGQTEEGVFITLREASVLLGVSKGTVSRWTNEGKIKDNGVKGQGRKVSKASVLIMKLEREEKQARGDYEDYKRDIESIPDLH